jgi:phosphoribosyl 1,2-cyclic phosphodiesterase
LPGLLRQCAPAIFSTPGTLLALERPRLWDEAANNGGAPSEATLASVATGNRHILEKLLHPLPVGVCSIIGDVEVRPFPVSHDAAEPCGYLLSAGGWSVGIVIDSGEVTLTMLDAMKRADLLVLESNHDLQRLLRGPYPYHLKQRILSSTGHLSNDQAAEAVLRTWRGDSLRWLWLSHLSRTNNTPRLALKSMVTRLAAANANLSHIHISVLPPDQGYTWDSAQLWHEPSLWEWRG